MMQHADNLQFRKTSLGDKIIGVAGPLAGVFLTLYATWIVLGKDIRFLFEQEPSSLEIKADESLASPKFPYQSSSPASRTRRNLDYK
jgi:hypothetical protein